MNNLGTVVINNSIIGEHMFFNDNTLDNVVVPTHATEIRYAAFGGCTSLTNLTVPFIGKNNNTNTAYDEEKVLGFFFGKTSDTNTVASPYITQNGINYAIPESLKVLTITVDDIISDYALVNTKLEQVIIDTIETIGSYAFNNMDSLVNVGPTLLDTTDSEFKPVVEFITEAEVTTRNTNNTTDANVTRRLVRTIGAHAFEGCALIEKVVIDSSIQAVDGNTYNGLIGDYAFSDMPELDMVVINNTVIGNHMFDNSPSLTQITIGSQVKVIGSHAFANSAITANTNTNGLDLHNDVIGEYMFYNNDNLVNVIVPNCIETIGYAAFGGCTNIESMSVPFVGMHQVDNDDTNNIENLFGYIFGHTVDATMDDIVQSDGITTSYNAPTDRATSAQSASATLTITNENKEFTFYVPKRLKTVVITNETVISEGAFMNFDMIESLTLKANTTTISKNAFKGDSKLQSIFIPKTVTQIGVSAFEDCTSLESVTFENGINLITIEEKVFKNNPKLEAIHSNGNTEINQFPASVTTINTEA